jgi:hypothetical protein
MLVSACWRFWAGLMYWRSTSDFAATSSDPPLGHAALGALVTMQARRMAAKSRGSGQLRRARLDDACDAAIEADRGRPPALAAAGIGVASAMASSTF